jgi:PAS domain-containing protein
MPELAAEMADAQAFARGLTVAAFLVDPEGALVYYNAAAGRILGSRYEDTGGMSLAEWSTRFEPARDTGAPLMPGSLPLVVALRERKPAQRTIWIKGGDGARRHIAITAVPVTGPDDSRLGAMALFWEADI